MFSEYIKCYRNYLIIRWLNDTVPVLTKSQIVVLRTGANGAYRIGYGVF